MTPRTLNQFLAEIAMLDAVATRALDPEPPAVVSGFDDDFKEVVVFDQNNVRTSARQEQDPILLPCQIETQEFAKLQQFATGNTPGSKVSIVVAMRDLRAMNLIVPETGECLVRTSDRLVAIRDSCRCLVQAIQTPPGLYVTEVLPAFGMSRERDFLLFTFEDREQFQRG